MQIGKVSIDATDFEKLKPRIGQRGNIFRNKVRGPQTFRRSVTLDVNFQIFFNSYSTCDHRGVKVKYISPSLNQFGPVLSRPSAVEKLLTNVPGSLFNQLIT